uniref:Reversion-to-ethylene sensitivity 1 n=1 Tax=Dianthus caryophyllus TaxID=3570 RepID=E9NM91_DIACA|nr:reversion-to-ethylene sensitivity 1 [Dianthus caryophyllus]
MSTNDEAEFLQGELWPLVDVDPKKARFPCCLVWTPLPVVAWLAPFIGHFGICQEDGSILDFSGSNLVSIDDFAFGSVIRFFISSHLLKCCFPPNLSAHSCKHGYKHHEYGTALSWDDALHTCKHEYETKTYNLFTCNCHSFVANCLNRLCYGGSMRWNMINVAILVLCQGHWVDTISVLRSFLPFVVVLCLGVYMVGWPFVVAWFLFASLLVTWFVVGTYFVKDFLKC